MYLISPRRPLLFLLTSKWLIYKVESYDEVQNLKSCTLSLRSSSPLNKEARKAWLGTTTSNVSLSLWAGSTFLIALIKFLTIYNAIIHHFLSYLLCCIAVCKHSLKSTEVKLTISASAVMVTA